MTTSIVWVGAGGHLCELAGIKAPGPVQTQRTSLTRPGLGIKWTEEILWGSWHCTSMDFYSFTAQKKTKNSWELNKRVRCPVAEGRMEPPVLPKAPVWNIKQRQPPCCCVGDPLGLLPLWADWARMTRALKVVWKQNRGWWWQMLFEDDAKLIYKENTADIDFICASATLNSQLAVCVQFKHIYCNGEILSHNALMLRNKTLTTFGLINEC